MFLRSWVDRPVDGITNLSLSRTPNSGSQGQDRFERLVVNLLCSTLLVVFTENMGKSSLRLPELIYCTRIFSAPISFPGVVLIID